MLFRAFSFSLTNQISVSFFKFWELFPIRPSFVQLSCPLVFGQQVGQRGLFSLFLSIFCPALHTSWSPPVSVLFSRAHSIFPQNKPIVAMCMEKEKSYSHCWCRSTQGDRGGAFLCLLLATIDPMHLPTHPTPSPTFLTFLSLWGRIVIERDAHYYFITLSS